MAQDEDNFNKIYYIYQPKILCYLARMVGESEAMDLTQDVFLKVNSSLDSLKDRSRLSVWIYRIATNRALDRLKSPSFKGAGDCIPEEELVSEDRSLWNSKKAISMDQRLIEQEMNDCIRNYIYSLPETYRIVLVLSELEGLKNMEIAEILEITLDTVKIRLHRARARLKRVLNQECDFYHDSENRLA